MNLQSYFEYNYKMNELLIENFLENADAFPMKAMQLFSHTLNAHSYWNNNIMERPELTSWQEHSVDSYKDINMDTYRSSIFIIENYDPQDIVNYKNSLGNTYKNTIHDILFHVINHSTYHRGQITMLTRDSGINPVSTDYIFFKREN